LVGRGNLRSPWLVVVLLLRRRRLIVDHEAVPTVTDDLALGTQLGDEGAFVDLALATTGRLDRASQSHGCA